MSSFTKPVKREAHRSVVIHRKGKLNPISVAIKIRQGRKAVTLITGFEPFLVNADELGEELRKLCAAQTSGTAFPSFSISFAFFSSPTVPFFENSDGNHAEIEPNGSARTRKTRKSSDGVPNQQGHTQEVDRGGRLDGDGEEEINT